MIACLLWRGVTHSVMTKHVADTLGGGDTTSEHAGYMAGSFAVCIILGTMVGGAMLDKFHNVDEPAKVCYSTVPLV